MPEAIVCIFAKPPIPGSVKTRLIPELGPERTAELAEAFLQDTVAMVRTLPWAECIIAATKAFERPYFKPEEVWMQSEGDLGERLEKVLRLALKRKPIVLAIGADSPGLPAAYLQTARDALKTLTPCWALPLTAVSTSSASTIVLSAGWKESSGATPPRSPLPRTSWNSLA